MEEKYIVMVTSPLNILVNFTSVDAGVLNVNVAKDKDFFPSKIEIIRKGGS